MEPFRFLASVEGAVSSNSNSGEGLLPIGFQPDGWGALLTCFKGTGEGDLQRFGELLVFLAGEGELWLLLRTGELITPFLGRVGDSLHCLVGLGDFLRGDGELLPLFTGEGELSRRPFGNADL